MNGYDLSRGWFNFRFQNPQRVRPVHTELYFYVIDLWNRLGQKNQIGLPTSVTMQMLNIGSYNTYKNVLEDLIEFGFITMISYSKNQHKSKIVALSKIDKATDTPLDVAISISDKATDEPSDEATDKATDTIDKQLNKQTIKQSIYLFSSFWDLYDKKKDTAKCKSKWDKIDEKDRATIKEVLPIYIKNTPNEQFRKNPLTWLNGKCWLDEVQENELINKPKKEYSQW